MKLTHHRMIQLSPSYFFDLGNFSHAHLFKECEFVFEALEKVKAYFDEFFSDPKNAVIQSEIPEGVFLHKKDKIYIGKNVVIEPGASITGPVWIGDNTVIRHGAYIRGGFLCGRDCVIGHATEVKNSIFLDHVEASHFNYIGDSILGNRAHLGAGVKCSNLRLDRNNIQIKVEDKLVHTGLRKLGAIIGDDAQIGCNSVTNPGTVIGRQVIAYPCITFGGFLPSQTIVGTSSRPVFKRPDDL